MVYVVLPVFNNIKSTKKFIKSVFNQTYQDIKIVICDDGSTDGTAEYITENYPDIVLLNGSGDLWWTAGINLCIKYVLEHCSDNDYVLTINNDVQLGKNYIEQKVKRAVEFPDTIIGSVCVFKDNPDLIETSGHVMDFKKTASHSLTRIGEKRSKMHHGVKDVTQLPGKGVLIPVKVFKTVGIYDEKNLPQYHADSDLTLRAHKAGFKVVVDFDSIVISDINYENLGYTKNRISIKGFINTFRGRYSINNLSIRRNFAKKHFPDNYNKYLINIYIGVLGGFLIRYIKSKTGNTLN